MLKKFSALLLATSLLGVTLLSGTAQAVTGADWRAGRIIDDSVFTNKDAMSVGDIQNFLNQQVGVGRTNGTAGVCDTNGVRPSELGGGTRAQYGAANGNPAPFTCLKDYYEVPKINPGPGVPANNYGGLPIPPGARSAAQLIWDAAQTYRISPKVLLVTIQKESAGPLITDDWPLRSQYTYAMGAYCPDSGPNGSANCDPNYAGFSIQIAESAGLLRWYLDNMHQPWWSYKKPGNNAVRFHPNAACGSSNVFIESMATAALYTYTPYQPNATALSNLYGGQNDGCSSYGNRNFWRMYNDWFGSTLGPSFDWSLHSQQLFTDQTKTVPAGNSLLGGTRVYAVLKIRNSGNQNWTKNSTNTVRLGTMRPLEHASAYCDSTWLSCSRPAGLVENTVAPGEVGTFEFWMKAPPNGGSYSEYFGPVVEGVTWMRDIGLFYLLHVQSPFYSWQMTNQYVYTDATKTVGRDMANLRAGEKIYVGFKAKNTGNVTWSNAGQNPIRVGTLAPIERSSVFAAGSNWLGSSRPGQLVEASVPPGQIGTFEFWLTVPDLPGTYHERFGLVAEGRGWMNDVGLSYYARIVPSIYSWQMVSQYVHTDATKTVGRDMANLQPGEKIHVGFTAKNTGNTTWTNNGANPIRVGTLAPIERSSIFAPGSSWLGASRPGQLVEASVAPGAVGTFEFWLTVPANRMGTYHERFGLVAEGRGWMNDVGLSYYARIIRN